MSKDLDIEKLIGIVALFLHAANIDENYTEKEKNLIINFLKNFTKDEELIVKIISDAELLEKNSNQILDYTNNLKANSLESKSIIIKELWKIILSDENSDDYENNLMRRICGLIYFPDDLSGELKTQVIKEKKL
ncbi:MAG: TerB family tellurite resistance protein [Pelagibacteraceae bacterium]|tara:strand:- start:259 stop:660 length:402 start_codon:yes stop_codon:yes gene_type:complete